MTAKRLSRLLLLIVVIIAVWLLWRHVTHSPSGQTAAPPNQPTHQGGGRRAAMNAQPPVQAAQTRSASVPYTLSALGTVTAANTVTVRSRVNGELMAVHFQEGQQVTAGALLAEIDPRPYQVELIQAQGQLAKDQATLANARQDLARYRKLATTNVIAQQALDAQLALVRQSEGAVKADEGAVASAELQLAYSKITAPISGRVGLRQIDVGNYITSSDANGIVVITQNHPIDVVFSMPEDEIAAILKARKTEPRLTVEAWDRANRRKLSQGSLLSMDNQIDAATGTIKLKARFENSDDALFPNQFVNIRMQVATRQNAIIVPSAAVQMGNEGHFVWIINDKNEVSKRLVSTDIQYGQHTVISAGLDENVRVVTDGVDRLSEGARVDVVPSAATPTPMSTLPAATGEKP